MSEIHIRFTPENRQKIEELKSLSGLSYNKIVNKLVEEKPLPLILKAQPDWVGEMMRELRYISTNLNQLAIKANVNSKVQGVELQASLKETKKVLNDIQKSFRETTF